MNLRERIADWISGGALTRAKQIQASLHHQTELAREWERAWSVEFDDHQQTVDIAARRRVSLQSIIDCETPSANATVRRMTAIAREALQ